MKAGGCEGDRLRLRFCRLMAAGKMY